MIDIFEGCIILLGFLINVFILNYWLILPSVVVMFFYAPIGKRVKKFIIESKNLEL